jgi:phosphoribosylformimino-5-aminoimidazole carboxamide ribotide isomerase
MLVIPAIDLLDGKCVRLRRGRREEGIEFDVDPVELAKSWFEDGIRRIHIVDLNGAFEGIPRNLEILGRIARSSGLLIQFGGGIRDMGWLEKAFSLGATWAIIGTAAVEDRDFLRESIRRFGDRIMVSIDSSMGMVATKGWLDKAPLSPRELASELIREGVRSFVFTATERDGSLEGPDIEGLSDFLLSLGGMAEAIAAGGISSTDHIASLLPLEPLGLKGVIIGRAILEGRITIREAMEVVGRCSQRG